MISWPWDSVIEGFDQDSGFPLYDRSYTAEQLREVLMTFFSNGVFAEEPNAFTVKADEGMAVTVSPGRCFVQGDVGVERSDRTLVFGASTSQPRYDTIVLRWDNNLDARSIDLYVKQGVASDRPSRPSLTRGETVYELGICDVFIPANSDSIANGRITDTRLETARCGIVTPFATIDTTTFYNQITEYIERESAYISKEAERILKELENDRDAQMRQLQAATDKAVQLAKDLVDETFAGDVLKMLETIAKEHTLYTTIDDASLDPLDDQDDQPITGALVFATARKRERQ